MLFGFTTSFRFGQILQYQFTAPKHHSDIATERYMVSEVIPAIREALKTHGYTKVESNTETGGTCMVGYQGRLFTIDSDFQVGESVDPFDAIGCGHDLAIGSIYTSLQTNPKAPPEIHLRLALDAAERYSAGVAAPFVYLSTGGNVK
jgi:hypothetical protein